MARQQPAPKPGPGGKSGAERRAAERVPADVPFRLVSGGKADSFDLVDLSESGVRIRCHASMAPMTKIQVAMVLPAVRVGASSDVQFQTTGVVVWSHKTGPGTFDTGVFFSEMDDRQRHLLRSFVASHVA
jgi:hypothetical protein